MKNSLTEFGFKIEEEEEPKPSLVEFGFKEEETKESPSIAEFGFKVASNVGMGGVAALTEIPSETLGGIKTRFDYINSVRKKNLEEEFKNNQNLSPETKKAIQEALITDTNLLGKLVDKAKQIIVKLPKEQELKFSTKFGRGLVDLVKSFIPGAVAIEVYGSSFEDAVSQGKTMDEADSYATSQALAQEAEERLGGKLLGKAIKDGGGIVKAAVKGFTSEAIQETTQEGTAAGLEKLYGVKGATGPQRYFDAALLGGLTGGVAGGAGAGANRLMNKPQAEPVAQEQVAHVPLEQQPVSEVQPRIPQPQQIIAPDPLFDLAKKFKVEEGAELVKQMAIAAQAGDNKTAGKLAFELIKVRDFIDNMETKKQQKIQKEVEAAQPQPVEIKQPVAQEPVAQEPVAPGLRYVKNRLAPDTVKKIAGKNEKVSTLVNLEATSGAEFAKTFTEEDFTDVVASSEYVRSLLNKEMAKDKIDTNKVESLINANNILTETRQKFILENQVINEEGFSEPVDVYTDVLRIKRQQLSEEKGIDEGAGNDIKKQAGEGKLIYIPDTWSDWEGISKLGYFTKQRITNGVRNTSIDEVAQSLGKTEDQIRNEITQLSRKEKPVYSDSDINLIDKKIKNLNENGPRLSLREERRVAEIFIPEYNDMKNKILNNVEKDVASFSPKFISEYNTWNLNEKKEFVSEYDKMGIIGTGDIDNVIQRVQEKSRVRQVRKDDGADGYTRKISKPTTELTASEPGAYEAEQSKVKEQQKLKEKQQAEIERRTTQKPMEQPVDAATLPGMGNEVKAGQLDLLQSKAPRASQALESTGGDKIGLAEKQEVIPAGTEEQDVMKLAKEVLGLVRKYGKRIGEGFLRPGVSGTYYNKTENIFINGMTNLSTACHELAHAIDFKYKISNKIRIVEGYDKSGKPKYEKETNQYRKELSRLYLQYYGGAKPTHSVKKKTVEGFATLIQKYIIMPRTIYKEYPFLVNNFIFPDGRYTTPEIQSFIKDSQAIISKFQGLPGLDKVGAFVVDNQKRFNPDKPNSFMSFGERFRTFIADEIFPMETVEKASGKDFTDDSVSLHLRRYHDYMGIAMNNITKAKDYYQWKDGSFQKRSDSNIGTLVKRLESKKISEEFGFYLVARAYHEDYKRLDELKSELKDLSEMQETGEEVDQELADKQKEYEELRDVLGRDAIDRKTANQAYEENKNKFTEEEKLYDELVQYDLDFLNDKDVQLLNDEDYEKYKNRKGYASRKRYFYNEITGEQTKNRQIKTAGTKVSSLIRRKGSQKEIINPVYSLITNHIEATRKGFKQIVYNKLLGIAQEHPDLFQEIKLQVAVDNNGAVLFPQEGKPDIVMARRDYKKVPIVVNKEIKNMIDGVLQPQSMDFFADFLRATSRMFTKGTTQLYYQFSLSNLLLDQVTASMNSEKKYIPFLSAINTGIKTLTNKQSKEAVYVREYLQFFAERQTMVGWQNLTSDELFKRINGETNIINRITDYVNQGLDIVSFPARASETASRVTEYVKSRSSGESQIVAAERAARITGPFSHMGKLTPSIKVLLKAIPFLNASIQILDQASRRLETEQGRKKYIIASSILLAATMSSMAAMLYGGDDEQKRELANLEPEILSRYLFFPHPDGKKLIRIRIPELISGTGTLIQMKTYQKKLNAYYSKKHYFSILNNILPAGIDVTSPVKTVLNLMPRLISPGLLVGLNLKTFPRIGPLEQDYMKTLPKGERYYKTTTTLAKNMAKYLGLSPIQFDALMYGYLGRATGYIAMKPGIFSPSKPFVQESYPLTGIKINYFYEQKNNNNSYVKQLKTNPDRFSKFEQDKILERNGLVKEIEALLDIYKYMEKHAGEKGITPEEMDNAISTIYTRIDALLFLNGDK